MRKSCREKEVTNEVKGYWSKQEDLKLIDYIQKHGEGRWRSISQGAGLRRCGKSCRLRWLNYLRPDLKHGDFGEDEEDLIIRLHSLLGDRWSLIAGRLPGRTDNEIKNYWNSHIKKKLIKMGYDPNNHHYFKGFNVASGKSFDHKEDGTSSKHVSLHGLHSQISDSTSGKEGSLHNFPDLNLDLTYT